MKGRLEGITILEFKHDRDKRERITMAKKRKNTGVKPGELLGVQTYDSVEDALAGAAGSFISLKNDGDQEAIHFVGLPLSAEVEGFQKGTVSRKFFFPVMVTKGKRVQVLELSISSAREVMRTLNKEKTFDNNKVNSSHIYVIERDGAKGSNKTRYNVNKTKATASIRVPDYDLVSIIARSKGMVDEEGNPVE